MNLERSVAVGLALVVVLLVTLPLGYVALTRSSFLGMRSTFSMDTPSNANKSGSADGAGASPPPSQRLPWLAGMDERIAAFYRRYVREQGAAVPAHGLLYFGHLYAEYRFLKPTITDEGSLSLLEEISARRTKADQPITWNDVYAFDLELTKFLPPESLLRKAYELRDRYRGVVGHREYDAYLASKPPDLAAFGIRGLRPGHRTAPTASEDAARSDEVQEVMLREDVKYLMSRVYLGYALLPLREGIRTELTRKGVRWTVTFVVFLAACIIISLVGAAFPDYRVFYTLTRLSTIGVIGSAGIVGGLVSMLQRIQAASGDADALHSIDSLSNGWRGIFLAPLSGLIFASLLFALFAGGILKGSVFPEIRASVPPPVTTPATTRWARQKESDRGVAPEAGGQEPSAQTAAPDSSALTPAAPGAAGDPSAASSAGQQRQPPAKPAEGANAAGPRQTGDQYQVTAPGTNPMPFKSFLTDTGPASGPDFALLIVWSFIAGFAERLVPDTLNRLVAKASPPAN
jgi:hypothetical protein